MHLQTPAAITGALLTLTDALGRVVLRQMVVLQTGANQLDLPSLAGLPAGVYALQLPLDGKLRALRLVKQ